MYETNSVLKCLSQSPTQHFKEIELVNSFLFWIYDVSARAHTHICKFVMPHFNKMKLIRSIFVKMVEFRKKEKYNLLLWISICAHLNSVIPLLKYSTPNSQNCDSVRNQHMHMNELYQMCDDSLMFTFTLNSSVLAFYSDKMTYANDRWSFGIKLIWFGINKWFKPVRNTRTRAFWWFKIERKNIIKQLQ